MNTTDPIADMLTRIRNANSAKHKTVDVPASKMKTAIAEILFREGYIKSFEVISNENQGIIRITLKYDEKGTRVIDGIKRISKPGLRVYAGKEELPKVLNGLGIAIISTSKHKTVDIPASKMKTGIAEILFKEGYIKAYEEIKDENQGIIRVTLKYDEKGNRVIDGLRRISKPGLRVYASKEELPKVLNGLGIAIISTSQGLKTDKEARQLGVGGEVLAYVW